MDLLSKTQKEIIEYALKEKPSIRVHTEIPYPLWNQIRLCYDFSGIENAVDRYLAKYSEGRQKIGFGS